MYPVAGFGLATQGPAALVANVTVGLLTFVVSKFQALFELVTADSALVTPVVVPSSASAAASAAESQYACVSFLAINILPISRAKPRTPMRAKAARAIVTSTKPRSWPFWRVIDMFPGIVTVFRISMDC